MFNLFGHISKSILQEFLNNADESILAIFSKTLFNNQINILERNNDADDHLITFDQHTDDDQGKNEDVRDEDKHVTASIQDDSKISDKKYRRMPKKVADIIDEDTEDNKQKHIDEIQKMIDNKRKECKSIEDALPIFEKCFE
jgi:hypothetical protein